METQNPHFSADDTIFNDIVNEPAPVTKNIRFLNYIIDIVIFYILSIMFGVLLGIFSLHPGRILLYLFSYGIFFLYYFLLELSSGKTIGKLITRSKVVSSDGTRPTSKQIALRSLSRLVPFEPFSFLANEGWHDRWTDTMVVKNK